MIMCHIVSHCMSARLSVRLDLMKLFASLFQYCSDTIKEHHWFPAPVPVSLHTVASDL